MRTRRWFGLAGIVLGAGSIGPAVGAVSMNVQRSPIERPDLELRAMVLGTINRQELETARRTLDAVMRTADVLVAWRSCGTGECSEPNGRIPSLHVLLLPELKATDATVTGEVARNGTTGAPTVLVYRKRAAQVAETLRVGVGPRAEFFTATAGHIVGLTLAHEIGHVLGLRHRKHGPMKATWSENDLVHLRRSLLRFEAAEAAAMREALQRRIPNASQRPVSPCGAKTGFDSGEPRCRR